MTNSEIDNPRMFYFGPWRESGHHFHGPGGSAVDRAIEKSLPWGPLHGWTIDCGLIPNKNYRAQGEAWITHDHGWTALSFWDMSVDTRPASHSTYIAEGTFTFDEMVRSASRLFADRWNRMRFSVTAAVDQHPNSKS